MTEQARVNRPVAAIAASAQIGKYICLRLLSEGGQGTLYLVHPQTLSATQRVLLRVQLWVFGPSQALVERFQLGVVKIPHPTYQAHLYDERGYLSLPNVAHKHLGQLYTRRFRQTGAALAKADIDFINVPDSSGQIQHNPYITLAYEPGGSLRTLLQQRKHRPLKPAQVVRIALQLADVLSFLHTGPELIYNDLAPDNVLLHERLSPWRKTKPTAVLIDLGAADSLSSPRHCNVYGRAQYMPPERLRTPPAAMSAQVDIYGLGMLMYELLAGKLEYQSTADLLNPERQLKPISALNPHVSRDLNHLVMQAVDRDAERRAINLPTMAAFQRALRNLPEEKQSGKLRGPFTARAWVQLASAVCVLLLMFSMTTQLSQHGAQATNAPATAATMLPTVTLPPSTATATATPQPTPPPTSTLIPTPTTEL